MLFFIVIKHIIAFSAWELGMLNHSYNVLDRLLQRIIR